MGIRRNCIQAGRRNLPIRAADCPTDARTACRAVGIRDGSRIGGKGGTVAFNPHTGPDPTHPVQTGCRCVTQRTAIVTRTRPGGSDSCARSADRGPCPFARIKKRRPTVSPGACGVERVRILVSAVICRLCASQSCLGHGNPGHSSREQHLISRAQSPNNSCQERVGVHTSPAGADLDSIRRNAWANLSGQRRDWPHVVPAVSQFAPGQTGSCGNEPGRALYRYGVVPL